MTDVRRPGYFNKENYYSFEQDKNTLKVFIMSECCGDTLDIDAAIELRNMLNDYIRVAI